MLSEPYSGALVVQVALKWQVVRKEVVANQRDALRRLSACDSSLLLRIGLLFLVVAHL